MSENYQKRDGIELLRSQTHHVRAVQCNLGRVIRELQRRRDEHDLSKMTPEEFPGFARINGVARNCEYGSDEYRSSLDAERGTIDRHCQHNDHHPEYHEMRALGLSAEAMPFLAIIEMVCDWRGAWEAYGKRTTWRASMEVQRQRFLDCDMRRLSDEQWWLVEQVAQFLDDEEPR